MTLLDWILWIQSDAIFTVTCLGYMTLRLGDGEEEVKTGSFLCWGTERAYGYSVHTSLGQQDMWEVSSASQIYATKWMRQRAS